MVGRTGRGFSRFLYSSSFTISFLVQQKKGANPRPVRPVRPDEG